MQYFREQRCAVQTFLESSTRQEKRALFFSLMGLKHAHSQVSTRPKHARQAQPGPAGHNKQYTNLDVKNECLAACFMRNIATLLLNFKLLKSQALSPLFLSKNVKLEMLQEKFDKGFKHLLLLSQRIFWSHCSDMASRLLLLAVASKFYRNDDWVFLLERSTI